MHRKHSLALISSAKARNTPNNLYSTNVASSSSPAVGKLRCKNQKRSYSELSITHTDTSNTCILLSRRPEQCISRLKAYNIQSRDAQCSRFYSSGVRVSSTYKAYDGRREFATKPKRVKPPRSDSYAANRTILVSPWRGPPTFLHALAFVREIEAKYGKVWWAGLEKDRANPYEYKPRIVVIFEDAKSVSKIPGFAFRSVNEPMDADVSPSSSRGGETGATTLTPLFIPWSDTLHKAAYRKGGPALENVLAFLEKKTLQPSPEISAAGSTTQVSLSGLENSSVSTATPQQASWSEFDEAVSIDAVLKPWTSDRVYLPQRKTPYKGGPYFPPRLRRDVAQAWIDFGGFSREPVESMKQSIENWNHELNRENTIGWVPYREEENAPGVVAGDPTAEATEGRAKSREEDDWEWEDLVNWGPTPPLNSDTSKPNYRYEPIGTLKGVPENDPEQEQDDWDPSQPHPLQFPDHLRTSGLGEALKAYGTQTREAQEKPTRKGDRSWDTWRYEPRPFRNSVGADERLTSPHPTHHRGVESMGPVVAHRIERRPPTYSSPPRGPSAFTSYPVKRGSHSTKSAGWDKDKRGRKMRQRDWEEMQPSGFGQADDMLLGQDENEFSLSGVLDAQEAPAGAQEKEMQEEKRVADRLRAILDGTN